MKSLGLISSQNSTRCAQSTPRTNWNGASLNRNTEMKKLNQTIPMLEASVVMEAVLMHSNRPLHRQQKLSKTRRSI